MPPFPTSGWHWPDLFALPLAVDECEFSPFFAGGFRMSSFQETAHNFEEANFSLARFGGLV